MFKKIQEIENYYFNLELKLSTPDIINNKKEYQKLIKEYSDLRELVEFYRLYKKLLLQIQDYQKSIKETDDEYKKLFKEELIILNDKKNQLEEKIKLLLMPKNSNDQRNVYLEIRAGAGGDEASLFVSDLFRLYTKYVEIMNWKLELVSKTYSSGIGGYKEIVALIKGKEVYGKLKYESGVHRVQRVPTTESQGRIHTSTVTVAILVEVEELEINLDLKDLKIDVYRSGGHGGQSVNTTDSAVRITHIPTGIVVICQDERSQYKNKLKAMKVLRARLFNRIMSEKNKKISLDRKTQIGTGDRSERIRTYNFPQGRITDHRIGLTIYNLEKFLNGEIQILINALVTHFKAKNLKV